MRYNLALLASVGLVGASLAADPGPVSSSTAPQIIQVTPADAQPAPKPSFGERLRNFFHPHRNTNPAQPSASNSRLAPIPSGDSANVSTAQGVRAKDLEGIGHEKDYSWVTGKLMHVGGRLAIRYANPDEIDQYGDNMLLTGSADLAKYHDGDLLCVYGKVTNTVRAPKGQPGAVYQATQVYLIPPTSRK